LEIWNVNHAPLPLPDHINSVEQLEDLLSEPTPHLIESLGKLDGDVLVLGVGGKMGPTLARMAVRASHAARVKRRVIGVSRFSDPVLKSRLNEWGVETISADLLDPQQLAALPDCPHVIAMPGMKFGSTGAQARTWAMNTYLAGMIAQRFAKSRIVAFSTGNIYSLSPVVNGGSREVDEPNPIGEYAMSCLGRERMYEHFCRTQGTPVSIVRLNYAVELRYGVIVDVAQQVWRGEPVPLSTGCFNAIWQGDANAASLAALAHTASPPFVFNLAGPEILSVRRVAEELGVLMHRPVTFDGHESPTALISNGQHGHRLFGYPRVSIEHVIRWIANWVIHGGASLGKPTHFETRDGKF
jgi:nucleoside-diphosphate-sugar epimerase